MYRPVTRCLLRQQARAFRVPTTRQLSTAPPHLRSRSWRNGAARWAIAAGGIYYYNTSTLFAEEPAPSLVDPPNAEDDLPTLASLTPSSRFQPPHPEDKPTIAPTPTSSSPPSIDPKAPEPEDAVDPSSPEALEEEASQQGAFNEETGEINWDCPCLGGMAHGPCGPEFREAFSCFVFSKEEPKGMDCIDKFKGMQNCFREHPDIYGAELEDDEDDTEAAGEKGVKVASALPEDAPNVAATEGSARTGLNQTKESVTEATKDKVGDIREKANEAQASITKHAVSAKDQVAEKLDDVKERVAAATSPEGGGHEDAPANDPNAGKKDGRLLSDQAPLGSSAIEELQSEENQLVPKAAYDATGKSSGSKTDK